MGARFSIHQGLLISTLLAGLLALFSAAAPSLRAEPAGLDAPAPAVRERFELLAARMAGAAEENPGRGGQPEASSAARQTIEETPLGLERATSSSFSGRERRSVPGSSNNWILSTLAALGLVIGLILFCRWIYQRLGGQVLARPVGGGGSSAIQILSRTAVAPRNHLVLARIGHRVLVLGDSPQGLRTLASLEDPDEVAMVLQQVMAGRSGSFTQGFSQMLERLQRDPQAADEADGLGEAEVHSQLPGSLAREGLSALKARVRAIGSRGGGV